MALAPRAQANLLVENVENAQAQLPAQMVNLLEKDVEMEMKTGEEWEEELV